MSPDAALAVDRFAHYASAMLLWGASAYLVALVPRQLADGVWRYLTPAAAVAAVVAAAAVAASLPIEAAYIGSGWSDAFRADVLGGVLLTTTVGQAWFVEAAAAVVAMLSFTLPSRARLAAMAISSGVLLAASALTGHATMQEGWAGIAHRLNDALHLLCAGAWLGALAPLAIILGQSNPEDRRDSEQALRRFSTAGHWVVGLLVASGMVDTALTLGRVPTDWSSPYQALLALKLLLVAAMIGAAIANRYAFVPQLKDDAGAAMRRIRRFTAAEIVLGTAVIALVAAFGSLDPS